MSWIYTPDHPDFNRLADRFDRLALPAELPDFDSWLDCCRAALDRWATVGWGYPSHLELSQIFKYNPGGRWMMAAAPVGDFMVIWANRYAMIYPSLGFSVTWDKDPVRVGARCLLGFLTTAWPLANIELASFQRVRL